MEVTFIQKICNFSNTVVAPNVYFCVQREAQDVPREGEYSVPGVAAIQDDAYFGLRIRGLGQHWGDGFRNICQSILEKLISAV